MTSNSFNSSQGNSSITNSQRSITVPTVAKQRQAIQSLFSLIHGRNNSCCRRPYCQMSKTLAGAESGSHPSCSSANICVAVGSLTIITINAQYISWQKFPNSDSDSVISGAGELLDGSHTQASSSRKTTGSGLITAIKLSSLCVLYDDDEGKAFRTIYTTVSILVSVSQAAKDIKALVACLRQYMPNRRKVISSPLLD